MVISQKNKTREKHQKGKKKSKNTNEAHLLKTSSVNKAETGKGHTHKTTIKTHWKADSETIKSIKAVWLTYK